MVGEIEWAHNIVLKNRTIVEYALKDAEKPIGVTSYSLTKKLPKELKDYLPSSKELKIQIDKLGIDIDEKLNEKNVEEFNG